VHDAGAVRDVLVLQGGQVTLADLIMSARSAIDQGEAFAGTWTDLARNRSKDLESCDLCGCDVDFMGDGDRHADWCPTLIAREVLGLTSLRSPP
jgi:hypothetical protein